MPTTVRGKQQRKTLDRKNRQADLHTYDGTFLVCRSYLHAWKPLGVYRENRLPVDVAVCSRCTTLRERFMDADANIIGTVYTYPDDYVIKGGMGHKPGANVRREYLRRTPAKHRDAVVPLAFRQ